MKILKSIEMKQILFLFVLIFFAVGCGEKESAHIINIDSLLAEYSIDSSLADIDSIEIRYYNFRNIDIRVPDEYKYLSFVALAYIHYSDGEYHIAGYFKGPGDSKWIKREIDYLKISNDTVFKLVELNIPYQKFDFHYYHPIMIFGNNDIVYSYQCWFELDSADNNKILSWIQDNKIHADTFNIYDCYKNEKSNIRRELGNIGGYVLASPNFDIKLSTQLSFSDDSTKVDTIYILSLGTMWFRHFLQEGYRLDASEKKRFLKSLYNYVSDTMKNYWYHFSPDLKILRQEYTHMHNNDTWHLKMIPALPESIQPLLIDSVLTDYEAIQKRMDILEISGLKDSVSKNIICFYTKEKLDKMLEELEKDSLNCSGDK